MSKILMKLFMLVALPVVSAETRGWATATTKNVRHNLHHRFWIGVIHHENPPHENDWDLLLQWIGSNQKHVARLLTNSSVLFPFASVNLRHPFNTVVCGNDGRCRTMRGPVRGWGGNPWRLLLLEIQSQHWWRRCRLCQRNNVFDKPSRHGRQRSCWSCLPICRKWRVCRR